MARLEAAARAGLAVVATGAIVGVLGLLMVGAAVDELVVWAREQRR